MYIPFRQRTASSFESVVRLLRNPEPDNDLIEITLSAPFSIIEIWCYSMTYAGRKGNKDLGIPSDSGLSKEEAFPVYDLLDKVFIASFPEFGVFDRKKASEHIQRIFRKVCIALVEGKRENVLAEIDTLISFSEAAIKSLKNNVE